MAARPVTIGGARFGEAALAVIAGPCVIEDEEQLLRVAERLRDLCRERGLPFVFKSSYKKANRSSIRSYTGPGLEEGLAALARVRRTVEVPVLTDVHETGEVPAAAEAADALQIPAFLSRQTELLVATAASGRPVNLKKGQFLAPDDVARAVEKLESGGAAGVLVTERGTSFGYHDLVVDFRSFGILAENGWPVVYDASHSLQRPGGEVSGGERRHAQPLARAAVACGVDALFFETHPEPGSARSDPATQIPLAEVPALLDACLRVREALAGAVTAPPEPRR